MPTTRKTQAKTPTAPKAAPAPAKATGLDYNTLLLAALAIQEDGTTLIPFSAYGEAMARQADIQGVSVETTPAGLEVTVDWKVSEEEKAAEDFEALATKGSPEKDPADPARYGSTTPSWMTSAGSDHDALANTGA